MTACLQTPAEQFFHIPGKAFLRPVHVFVTPELEVCAEEFAEALLSFHAQGVSMTLDVGEGWEPMFRNVTTEGVHAFARAPLSQGKRGETYRSLTLMGDILYAYTELAPGECRADIIAHELGHGLGLRDLDNVPGNLMCRSVECIHALPHQKPTLAPAQRAWIRD